MLFIHRGDFVRMLKENIQKIEPRFVSSKAENKFEDYF